MYYFPSFSLGQNLKKLFMFILRRKVINVKNWGKKIKILCEKKYFFSQCVSWGNNSKKKMLQLCCVYFLAMNHSFGTSVALKAPLFISIGSAFLDEKEEKQFDKDTHRKEMRLGRTGKSWRKDLRA